MPNQKNDELLRMLLKQRHCLVCKFSDRRGTPFCCKGHEGDESPRLFPPYKGHPCWESMEEHSETNTFKEKD